jgi:hypothetical protein
MLNRFATVLALGIGICLVGRAADADEPAKPYTTQTAFEALQTMVGDWVNEKNPDASQGMTVRMTGAGSTVATTLFPGSAMEMMSLFHLDGPDRLVHTHYCALQNQPTMHMVAGDRPGVIRFEFVSGTNMDVNKDMHSHNTEIHMLDDGKIKVVVEGWNEGKPSARQEFTMKRSEKVAAAK